MSEVSPVVASTRAVFDVQRVREDFPALHQDVHGKPLVYLDSAATTLKPQSVIDAVDDVYARDCANIHRAVHLLSQRATARFEEAREKVRTFLNASKKTEIVFTRGTTEAINLVAQSWGRSALRDGRRGSGHRARAPLEHRPLANALPADGSQARRGADDRPRRGPT